MTRLSDTELIALIALRDQEASAELFDRHAGAMLSFLQRRIGPAEADDLLQEVFVRALRGASAFRGDSSVRTWLFAIARYVLIERFRDRVELVSLVELAAPQAGPEKQAVEREGRLRLIAALETLPDDYALVLELHRIDGLSHAEIAELLGIASATSRKRLQRADRELRRVYRFTAAGQSDYSQIDAWRRSLLRRTVGTSPS